MEYFHVRLSVAGEDDDETKNDLDQETLRSQFLRPYAEGRSITLNGRSIEPRSISRIRISQSESPADQLIAQIEAEDRRSSVVVLGGPDYGWRAAARAADVTDEYVTAPPGNSGRGASPGPSGTDESVGGTSIFLIHGRDARRVEALRGVLRALGLRIVEWAHAVRETGQPNPYIGDVVVAGIGMAAGIVVLLTPDDEVKLRDDLLHDEDGPEEREMRGQPRPNVIYESGMAQIVAPERTIVAAIGNPKVHSDMAGRHLVHLDGGAKSRHRLVARLETAGLEVDDEGEDWLTVGDLS